jgi:hypothetical protein
MFRQIRYPQFSLKRLSVKKLYTRTAWLVVSLLIGLSLPALLLLSLRGLPPRTHAAAPTQATASAAPWPVFTPTYVLSPNLLINFGFEDDPPGNGWEPYGSGYIVDETVSHSGTRSLKLVNDVLADAHGALQVITFDPPTFRPLYFSGWSKAECVTGGSDSNYSVYLDVYYTEGPPSYKHVIEFDPCSDDWQFQESLVVPAKPIREVRVHCLLRWAHRGTVWFDDLSVQQVLSRIVFDSVPVTTHQPISQPDGVALTLTTTDGLGLALAPKGGTIVSVTLGMTEVQGSDHAYVSGFLVRDVISRNNPFFHVGGSL